ncbi:hypothetical protein TNCT_547341 [Trichonephila clavata]|uniref:Secreted protein n=1 Tax=Trichonephila clavata TaxID=2740835 RepID=A0A8X6K7I5_TRICU|nr:hypothetical protein TNCT_547341 [Trichonephila clavata]
MSVLPTLLYLFVAFTYTAAKCSRGEMESFILSTNALPLHPLIKIFRDHLWWSALGRVWKTPTASLSSS